MDIVDSKPIVVAFITHFIGTYKFESEGAVLRFKLHCISKAE